MPQESISQPTDLIRLVTEIHATPEGAVSVNRMDGDNIEEFQSEFYTPVFRLSALALRTRRLIRGGEIRETNVSLNEDTITHELTRSRLKTRAVDIFTLSQIVLLETFAIVYHSREDRASMRFLTVQDIKRTRENINYICDYLGTQEEFMPLISRFRNIHVALGYVENQIDLIRNSREVR